MTAQVLFGASQRLELLGGEPPEWVLVFPDGIYRTTKGNFLVDAAARESILATFSDYGNMLAWDFEHEGLYRAIEKKLSGGRIATAGYYAEFADRGAQGLWGRMLWTRLGREALQEGIEIYDSPLFVPEDYDFAASNGRAPRILELWGCTLTATPASKARVPLVRQEQHVAACRLVAASRRAMNREGSTTMYGSNLVPRNELKWLFDLGLGCTNRELREKLAAAANNVPDDDSLAFAIAVNRTADSPALPATIGAALDHELAAARSAATTAASGALITSAAVLEELGVPADQAGDEKRILGRVLAMKTGGVSTADHEKLRGELEAANRALADLRKAGGIDALVIETDRAGKLTPDREKNLRSIATSRGIDIAREVASAWNRVRPEAPAPTLEEPVSVPGAAATAASAEYAVGDKRYEATSESHDRAAAVEAFMAANKIATYREASEKFDAAERAKR